MIYERPKYKYEGAHDWLFQAIDNRDISWSEIKELLVKLEADDIQSVFESAMNDDHYFEQIIGRCDYCGEEIIDNTWVNCQSCGATVHEDCSEEHEGEIICVECYLTQVGMPED